MEIALGICIIGYGITQLVSRYNAAEMIVDDTVDMPIPEPIPRFILEIILNNVSSLTRWELSRCSKWLYDESWKISEVKTSQRVIDYDKQPIYMIFNALFVPGEIPYRDLVKEAYDKQGKINNVYWCCDHLIRRTHRILPVTPQVCRYADHSVLELIVANGTTRNTDECICCVGILAYRGFQDLAIVLIKRVFTSNNIKLINCALIGSLMSLRNIAWVYTLFNTGYTDSSICAANGVAQILRGEEYDNILRVNGNTLMRAYMSVDNVEKVRKMTHVTSMELLYNAYNLYKHRFISAEMLDAVAMHATPNRVNRILRSDDLADGAADVLLPYSDIYNVMLTVPGLALRAMKIHSASGKTLSNEQHALLLNGYYKHNDDVFDQLLTILVNENATLETLTKGLKYAVSYGHFKRVRKFLDLIDAVIEK